MPVRLGLLFFAALAFSMASTGTVAAEAPMDWPLVIGHRGAAGYRPEHTLASYELAIDMGADFIEPDLVSTKDGVLVARHENEISSTTDVAEHPEFANRRTTKVVDTVPVTGWFTEDFTLAELKTLRAKERIPEIRPQNTAYDGFSTVPTLQEIIDLVKHKERMGFGHPWKDERGLVRNRIGLYPETKHPTYFASIGLSLEEPLVKSLHASGYRTANAPVFIQSFEVGNLKKLHWMTKIRLVQLVESSLMPYDVYVNGGHTTYADMITPSGLSEIATYAQAIGPNKDLVLPRGANGTLLEPTTLVDDAHAAGLLVHAWTFRAENAFLPADLRQGDTSSPVYLRNPGNLAGEVSRFLDGGVDAFFTDNADIGVATRDAWLSRR